MNKFYIIGFFSLLIIIILFIIYQNNFNEYFISEILKDIEKNTQNAINENNIKIKEILSNN